MHGCDDVVILMVLQENECHENNYLELSQTPYPPWLNYKGLIKMESLHQSSATKWLKMGRAEVLLSFEGSPVSLSFQLYV